MQDYCVRKDWPEKLMKKLFYQLYENDVILEEAYGVWREDTTDTTPGKDKALFQVNEFLQWLDERLAGRAPFNEDEDAFMHDRVGEVLAFEDHPWPSLSQNAKDFVSQLLQVDRRAAP